MGRTGNDGGDVPPQNVVRLRPIHAHPAFRITIVGTLLIGVAAAFFVGRFLASNQPNRWLPERPGEAIVVEKIQPSAEDFRLRVRVLVPPASPEEAALLPLDYPGRADAMESLQLLDDVPTSEQDWSTVKPGDRLRASYQITVARSKVIVRALYLDHLQK